MARYFWRRYACECGNTWERLTEYRKNYVDPMDECERCAKKQETAESFTSPAPAIGGSIQGKAIEHTMNMLVNDYGVPGYQINDNMREGDIAVKGNGQSAGYMQGQAKATINDFLAAGRQAGGIGDGLNLTGNDIIHNAKGTFDPLKNMTRMVTDTKEYL